MNKTKLLPLAAAALAIPGIGLRALHLLNGFDVDSGLADGRQSVGMGLHRILRAVRRAVRRTCRAAAREGKRAV
ncbi:MAG: hypothetical protein ACLR4Z_03910 [Butyricicoccaceae bacterium]